MDVPTYSVAELGALVSYALDRVFPEDLWVAGEIRSLRRPGSGHVYFELTEPSAAPGAPVEAVIAVTLFRGTKEIVNRTLRQHGGIRIEDGMRVRIRGALDFYAPQGKLQLRMTGIDPAYTLGALAAEREQLLRRLQLEGVLEANAGRSLEPVPLLVGLVTSHGSAAAADFLHELEASGMAWRVRLVDTVVQGSGADRSIAGAVVLAGRLGVDVVAVVRGGGSRTDLVCFDAERVARAIAACPVPVFTGIGHEIDRSIADEVAHTATKTPTACAAALVAHVRRFADGVDERWTRIADRAEVGLDRAGTAADRRGRHAAALARTAALLPTHLLADRAARIGRLSGRSLELAARRTDRATALATATGRHRVEQLGLALGSRSSGVAAAARRPLRWEEQRVAALQARVAALDPALALARGWSITRTADGRLVRSPADVEPGTTLRTTLAGGTLESTVVPAGEAVDRTPEESP